MDYYGSLAKHGTNEPFRNRMLDFDGINALIGTPEMIALGKRYETMRRRPTRNPSGFRLMRVAPTRSSGAAEGASPESRRRDSLHLDSGPALRGVPE